MNKKRKKKNMKEEKMELQDTNTVSEEKNKQTSQQEQQAKEIITEELPDEKVILQQKIDELNDKNLRLYSEFDNYRKRMFKEKLELFKVASEEIITGLLPVLDDLERAVNSMNETIEKETMKEGIQLIYAKLKNILQQKGVEEIKSCGEIFNTDFHEAITNIPAESEEMKGKVAEEIQKGYTLNGKIIRFSKVVVAN